LDGDVKCLSYLILVVSILAAQSQTTRAEDKPSSAALHASDHAPRAYAVTLGGNYVFLSKLPLVEGKSTGGGHPAGMQLGGRFGWQVRGLRGGAPSTIGFESDLMYLPGRDGARDTYGLLYGVFAKHSFTHWRARPFFSYGLGASQIWVSDVGGRGIGHVTRLSFGVDIRVAERIHVPVALMYMGVLMPRLELEDQSVKDTSFHSAVLTTGVWFGS
jgi:hypothetical protein